MTTIMTYVLLIAGFLMLVKGAEWIVEGAANIARLMRVPPLLVGLTIVAFGTNSPEATITIIAAFNGNADLAMGNIVGSNILNISLVIGLAACLFPIRVENETIRKEIPFGLLGGVALLILISDFPLQTQTDAWQAEATNTLSRGDGLILLLFFAIFLYYVFEVARNSQNGMKADHEQRLAHTRRTWARHIAYTVVGLAAVILGSEFVVNSSVDIATAFGMSETLIGLTIVAIGTALPELITCVVAALKKQTELALGNIVGSNIFNIFFILGAASAIAPLQISTKIFTDIIVMIAFTVVLLVFSRTKHTIGRMEGALLTIAYIGYLIFIILRN